jgi:hypothetical protein
MTIKEPIATIKKVVKISTAINAFLRRQSCTSILDRVTRKIWLGNSKTDCNAHGSFNDSERKIENMIK